MRKRIGHFFIWLCFFCMSSSFAQAETDYRCLKLCLIEGKSYYKCKPECSYGDLQEKEEKDVLVNTPRLWRGNDVLEKQSIQKKSLQKDYVCLKACLKEGLQHSLCLQRCEKREESLENKND